MSQRELTTTGDPIAQVAQNVRPALSIVDLNVAIRCPLAEVVWAALASDVAELLDAAGARLVEGER